MEPKKVWQDEMHLAVGDHNIVKQEENKDCLSTEEKTNMKVRHIHRTFKPWKNLV